MEDFIVRIRRLLCIHKPSSKPSERVYEESGTKYDYIIHLRECAKCGKICEFPSRIKKELIKLKTETTK